LGIFKLWFDTEKHAQRQLRVFETGESATPAENYDPECEAAEKVGYSNFIAR
jgi:hypothetical protein